MFGAIVRARTPSTVPAPDEEHGIGSVRVAFVYMGRLFGTDGVRGTFGEDLTTDLAFGLGRAGVTVLRRHEPGRLSLVVGRDTRGSGEALEAAIVAGASRGGGRRDARGRRAHAGDRLPHDAT